MKREQTSPVAMSREAREILERLTKELKLPKMTLLDHVMRAASDYVETHQGEVVWPLTFTKSFVTFPMADREELLRVLYSEKRAAPKQRGKKARVSREAAK